MPPTPNQPPHPPPPQGVPRWLWPPPGATVQQVLLREHVPAGGAAQYEVQQGQAPQASHLRGLEWLLDEHPHDDLPRSSAPFEGLIRLEIARTELRGGRVGHAYALDGGPLGAPSADRARGILHRYICHHLKR